MGFLFGLGLALLLIAWVVAMMSTSRCKITGRRVDRPCTCGSWGGRGCPPAKRRPARTQRWEKVHAAHNRRTR